MPNRPLIWAAATVLATVATASSCKTAVPSAAPPPSPASPSTAAAAPPRTHEALDATVWMQTSVEYRASTLQAYHTARVALDAALADRHETAAIEQAADPAPLPPAVVLDLDETVLDNSAYEARQIADSKPAHHVGYDETTWRKWVSERKATAIPGAIEFLQYAKSRGVTPIYISNRRIEDADNQPTAKAATREVLARLGAPLDDRVDTLLMRDEHGWTSSDKGPRRAFIAGQFRILLLVGDNFEDFISVKDPSIAGRDALASRYTDWWGTRWIVLPNPTYGSWEQAITQGVAPDDAAGALAKKYGVLRLAR